MGLVYLSPGESGLIKAGTKLLIDNGESCEPTPCVAIDGVDENHTFPIQTFSAARIIRVRVPDSQGPFAVGQILLRQGDHTATVYRIHDSHDGTTLVDLILDPPGALVSELVPTSH